MTGPCLYSYQSEMVSRIESAFLSHRSVMVQMPTGTGKTRVLASVVRDEVRRAGNPVVWVVAHRRELVSQIEGTLKAFGLDPSGRADGGIRVMSVQWLARHYGEMADSPPSLIVIDEAHHAPAGSYAEVMEAFPEARKLGVTATPCRLDGRGFTALFETLLVSQSVSSFIRDGYLSDYDYVSLNPGGEDQRLIDGLERRGADGDYSVAEMRDVLDCRPSIERLYRTIAGFVPERRGIVYAISIEHAEHVAEHYRSHGLRAEAVSSETPADERCSAIGRFRDGKLDILVNVDLFSEGFDCPDVEFVQLARPTLSLSRYLQMVGRGLRRAEGKDCCVILDNVGQYRLFGLPSAERDWNALFAGRLSGKGAADPARDMALGILAPSLSATGGEDCDPREEMVVIARHGDPAPLRRLEGLAEVLRPLPRLRRTRLGYEGGGRYIRTADMPGVYDSTGETRMGWRLLRCRKDRMVGYCLLREADERIAYVGRRNPWTRYTEGVTERYATGASLSEPDPVTGETEYLPCVGRKPLGKGTMRRDRWGREAVAAYVFVPAGGMGDSKNAYVCERRGGGEYAVCNNRHQVILRGLARVRLFPDNIARAVFPGEDAPVWINLYTMQEFAERPVVERSGTEETLVAGGVRYAYRDRQKAGIPLEERQEIRRKAW